MNKTLVPNAGQYTLTRHLPKTGQTISYLANDDGDDAHERGWWPGRINSNNRLRFLAPGTIISDRATGLMWPSDCAGVGGNGGAPIGTWAAAIAWAETLNFAGFTDWHLPNINELISIVNWGANPCWYQPGFFNVLAQPYWSQTTSFLNVLLAMCFRFNVFATGAYNKAAPGVNIYVLAVREAAI